MDEDFRGTWCTPEIEKGIRGWPSDSTRHTPLTFTSIKITWDPFLIVTFGDPDGLQETLDREEQMGGPLVEDYFDENDDAWVVIFTFGDPDGLQESATESRAEGHRQAYTQLDLG